MKTKEFLIQNEIRADECIKRFGSIEIYNDKLREFLDTQKTRMHFLKMYKEHERADHYIELAEDIRYEAEDLGFELLMLLALQNFLEADEGAMKYIDPYYNKLVEELERVEKVCREYFD